MYKIKYKIKNKDKYVIIATIRPETLFGDTAVEINPDVDEAKDLIGTRCIVPIVNRSFPIIVDEPRHKLDIIPILDHDNKLLPEFESYGFSEKYLKLDLISLRHLIN